MGCCCSRPTGIQSGHAGHSSKKRGHYRKVLEASDERAYDQGGEVMNAIIAEMWPDMAFAMLEKMKKKTYPMRPYEMHIVSGRIGQSPTISDVKYVHGEEGKPVQYTCNVFYQGRPELEFALKGKKGKFISIFLPSVNVDLHWLEINAQIHVELSMKRHHCKFYFLKRPEVEWNLDVEVTKLDIPIHMEDMLDNRLERELQAINEENPYEINFGVDVKYKTKLGKSPKGHGQWNSTESFHIGQTDDAHFDTSRPASTHKLGDRSKSKLSSSRGFPSPLRGFEKGLESEAGVNGSAVCIDIIEAEDLSSELAADRNKLADPYAIAELRYRDSGHRLKKRCSTRTPLINDTLNPVWNHSERGWTDIKEELEQLALYVKVWDGDFLTSDPLGGFKIPINKVAMLREEKGSAGASADPKWYPLEKFGTKMKLNPTGRVKLRLWCEAPARPTTAVDLLVGLEGGSK